MKALGWWVAVLGSPSLAWAPGQAEKVNFPPLFAVEVRAMKLWELGAEKPRETAIRNVDWANNKMILNGAEGEWGWTVLVNEANGKMSATAAGDGEGFVVFGQCALS
jgi:hypothetical protein